MELLKRSLLFLAALVMATLAVIQAVPDPENGMKDGGR
ncbi:hypothetical protein X975_02102, partial [Stegodyphus mimosarum]